MSNWTTDDDDSLQMEEDGLLVLLTENLDSRKQETGDFWLYLEIRPSSPSDLRRMGDPLASKKGVEQKSIEMDRRVGVENKDLLVSEGEVDMVLVVGLVVRSTLQDSSS